MSASSTLMLEDESEVQTLLVYVKACFLGSDGLWHCIVFARA